MKIESPNFTELHVRDFLHETLDHEGSKLAERLESASTRLASLVEHGVERQGDLEHWSGQEILAHIVVLSKFYGVLASQVATGRMTEIDLLGAAQGRDLAAEPLLVVPPNTLLAMARREHRRTIEFLRTAAGVSLARRAKVLGGISMSAHEIATLALCAHLEIHLDQLEREQTR